MTEPQFRLLKSALASLSASTSLEVSTAAVGLQLDGRCSPYASHRTIEFKVAAGGLLPGDLLLLNGRHALGVRLDGANVSNALAEAVTAPRFDEFETDACRMTVPAAMLAGVLVDPGTYLPGGLSYAANALVQVAVRDRRRTGWTADGRPVFALLGEQRAFADAADRELFGTARRAGLSDYVAIDLIRAAARRAEAAAAAVPCCAHAAAAGMPSPGRACGWCGKIALEPFHPTESGAFRDFVVAYLDPEVVEDESLRATLFGDSPPVLPDWGRELVEAARRQPGDNAEQINLLQAALARPGVSPDLLPAGLEPQHLLPPWALPAGWRRDVLFTGREERFAVTFEADSGTGFYVRRFATGEEAETEARHIREADRNRKVLDPRNSADRFPEVWDAEDAG